MYARPHSVREFQLSRLSVDEQRPGTLYHLDNSARIPTFIMQVHLTE